tara:strand:- start:1377 stop:1619 length:243 start_codon:yes stop_codon:yes gene_type:complete
MSQQAKELKLSKQAMGAVMMALQKSLMEQSDIVPVLEQFKLKLSEEGLVVLNPPLVKFNEETTAQFRESEDETEETASTE